METKGKEIQRPIKPKFEDFNLDFELVNKLKNFKLKCEKKANLYLKILFVLISILGMFLVYKLNLEKGIIYIILITSAIISWGLIPMLFKYLTQNDLSHFVFEKTKNITIENANKNNILFEIELIAYKTENNLREKILRRQTWEFWLSLTPIDFEIAVGDLFKDKGFEVTTTSVSGDNGVDLYLKKDGKKIVVQCKTHKKTLGPNAARDLYGTMYSQNADEAILVAPSGFSFATKDFCRNKPIKLIDIDDLTKMTYDFENYTSYSIDNAKSIDDLLKINKKLSRRR